VNLDGKDNPEKEEKVRKVNHNQTKRMDSEPSPLKSQVQEAERTIVALRNLGEKTVGTILCKQR
jgi:hypothetical protein